MLTQEIISVLLSTLLAIALGIAVFAGNTKDKLTWKQILTMVIVGIAAGAISWTYLKDGLDTKLIVRSILIYTFLATILTKLIGRILNAVTNISEKRIQSIVIDLARKKIGLNQEQNDHTSNETQKDSDEDDSLPDPGSNGSTL